MRHTSSFAPWRVPLWAPQALLVLPVFVVVAGCGPSDASCATCIDAEPRDARPSDGGPDLLGDGGATLDAADRRDAAADWRDGSLDDSGMDAGDDCGPFGVRHGDHCDCEPGYEEVDGTCDPIGPCVGADPLEPDDRAREATPWPRETESFERWICPGDHDWFTLELVEGESLEVVCSFIHAEVNIDLALWEPGRDPRFDGPALRTVGTSDQERAVLAVTRTGRHLLRVSSPVPGEQGAYRIERRAPVALDAAQDD